MTNRIKVSDLPEFDATEYLGSEEDIAAYLTVVREENDPALLAAALKDCIDLAVADSRLAAIMDEALADIDGWTGQDDPAEHLTTAEAVAAFLADAEATADPAYIEHARKVAARARTMHGISS